MPQFQMPTLFGGMRGRQRRPWDEQFPPIAPQPETPSPAEQDLAALDAAPSRKQTLLRAVLSAAPIGLGALFGGTEGASGAASGVEELDASRRAESAKRRDSLMRQIEAERGRKFEAEQAEKNRIFQGGESEKGRVFTGAENAANRAQNQGQFEANLGQRRSEQTDDNAYRNRSLDENVRQFGLNMGQRKAEFDADTGFKKTSLAENIRQFDTGLGARKEESAADRALRVSEGAANRALTRSEGEADRSLKRDMETARTGAAGSQSPYSKERQTRVLQDIEEIKPLVGRSTAGFGAATLSNIGGTSATQLAAKLKTLKANIAFNELTEMRKQSKTGGALGAVSDREGQLLESALGALDQNLNYKDLLTELDKVKGSILRWQAEMAKVGGTQQSASGGTAPAGVDQAIWNVMTAEERALWGK